MAGTVGRAESVLLAPVSGEVVALSDAPDPAFAAGMLGPGFAVRPDHEVACVACAPAAGVVTAIGKPNAHALCLRTDDGLELLIHVGVDTVVLAGAFEPVARPGARVAAGEALLRFSAGAVAAAGLDPVVMVSAPSEAGVGRARLLREGRVAAGEIVCALG